VRVQAEFDVAEIAARRSAPSALADYLSLIKPRLSSLVLFTAAGGLWLSGAKLSLTQWILTLLATAGTVGAANAFNCVAERDTDRLMSRTARRPLPMGRLTAKNALRFAWLLAAVSVPTLALGVNLLTAALGVLALLSYVLVYTPMKRTSPWSVIAGAVPGAIPPLMGWTAGTGRIEWPGAVLFLILFVWQVPHTVAIALFREGEYRRAGMTSLPIAKGQDFARGHALLWLLVLVPVSALPSAFGVAGVGYLVGALLLGAAFLFVGAKGYLERGDRPWARQLFLVSLVYLAGLFLALGLDRALA
jgi:heme o synthase